MDSYMTYIATSKNKIESLQNESGNLQLQITNNKYDIYDKKKEIENLNEDKENIKLENETKKRKNNEKLALKIIGLLIVTILAILSGGALCYMNNAIAIEQSVLNVLTIIGCSLFGVYTGKTIIDKAMQVKDLNKQEDLNSEESLTQIDNKIKDIEKIIDEIKNKNAGLNNDICEIEIKVNNLKNDIAHTEHLRNERMEQLLVEDDSKHPYVKTNTNPKTM